MFTLIISNALRMISQAHVLGKNKYSESLAELQTVCDFIVGSVCVLLQCVDEGQGSGEESAFTAPRLLSGFEMKALLQWEESESHPLPTLEKLITVQIMHTCIVKVDAPLVFH